ncbi:MAG: polysulfide reductase NrfD [Brumimicrobium sp.]|nr:polysulfide reductase NrfD [Brumimicrobium sp.]
MHKEAAIREPLILGHKSYKDISDDICGPIEGKAPKTWYVLFTIASIIALYGIGAILYLLGTGIGTWGLNKTINWAWDITNFVWWVGIGHAGTLISAVLLLFRQKWRMAINRSAEAMTIFAVFMAGLFPLIHMGRLWVGYWVVPLPNHFGSLWPNFNSALLWDVFAISTYLSVSLVFWYIGLIPDFATIRDRAKKPVAKKMYSILSFGWSGKAKHWQRFETVSLVLAGLATPLVFSVHSIVSMDFATSIVPGWHSTIYPPYFVAGAVFSGFAMVTTLMLIVRKAFHLEAYITKKHMDYIGIVMVVTGGIVAVAYATEFFVGWYTGVEYEAYTYMSYGAATGKYWWAFWLLILCNVMIPGLNWFRKVRTNFVAAWIISIFVNIGMWFERFDIIVICLHQDFLPSSWRMFYPSHIDIAIYVGTLGIFSVFYLLFARYFPVLPIAEVKTILKSSGESFKDGKATSGAYSLEEQHLAKAVSHDSHSHNDQSEQTNEEHN